MAKPGLDGHSNGAEQIAVRARDCGMEILYDGIRLTPAQVVEAARTGHPHVIGLSVLSGSHMELIGEVMQGLRAAGVEAPVVAGGIIPEADARRLREMGVARVYTPKDFEVNRIIADLLALVAERAREVA
jgi:(2R)-ethylmalonyl-CoA mutase